MMLAAISALPGSSSILPMPPAPPLPELDRIRSYQIASGRVRSHSTVLDRGRWQDQLNEALKAQNSLQEKEIVYLKHWRVKDRDIQLVKKLAAGAIAQQSHKCHARRGMAQAFKSCPSIFTCRLLQGPRGRYGQGR